MLPRSREQARIDTIGDHPHAPMTADWTSTDPRGQPSRRADDMKRRAAERVDFSSQLFARIVNREKRPPPDHRTVAALRLVAFAIRRVVASAGESPAPMKRPDDRF